MSFATALECFVAGADSGGGNVRSPGEHTGRKMSLSRGDFPSSCMNQHFGKQAEGGWKRIAKKVARVWSARDTLQKDWHLHLKGQKAKGPLCGDNTVHGSCGEEGVENTVKTRRSRAAARTEMRFRPRTLRPRRPSVDYSNQLRQEGFKRAWVVEKLVWQSAGLGGNAVWKAACGRNSHSPHENKLLSLQVFFFFFLYAYALEMKRMKVVLYGCRFFLRKSTAVTKYSSPIQLFLL